MDSKEILAAFDEIAGRRGWQPLHTPKNLAMALSVEVAEMCRHLQWRSDREIEQLMQSATAGQVAAELADIQMYLLKLAAVLGVDMDAALRDKMVENRRRCAASETGK
ncbi:nucleotide pyrophosphohydrolase [Microbulbifer taiwanensis]|uniref:Nucleotide pyrophosphohydrolase n=1 Tax=Microbulbifer taiwanensis TaxID=986746 RepID=A0ABW1YGP7_9GAMM|nr:nucleotide pyrophosphohydrolase [Microbulbifer taiwanensis]